MFKKLYDLKKYKNLYDIKNFEVWLSVVIAIIVMCFFYHIKLYDEFSHFEEVIQVLLSGIIFAYFSFSGLLLAGVAIFMSAINNKLTKQIDTINGKDNVVEFLLYDFVILALVVAFQIVVYFFIYFAISSPIYLIDEKPFNIILFFCVYLFFYTVLSIAGIIKECIGIYNISNTYSKIIDTEERLLEVANEVRLDFLINSCFSNKDKEDFYTKLVQFVKACEYEEGKEKKLLRYFEQYYK